MHTILVADPDAETREQTCAILNDAGYTTIPVFSGHEAVQKLESESSIDLVVSEIEMPVMNGFTLTSYIKADPRLSTKPVLICSTVKDPRRVTEAIRHGVADIVGKPVSKDSLLEKISRLSRRLPGAVLVVDDEEILVKLLSNILKREGIATVTAGSGNDALEALEKNKIGVVLSDIAMPEMSGLELLAKIKELNATIPVLLMTGHGADYTKNQAMTAGADGYITKPFKNTEIVNQLRQFIAFK